MENMPGRGGAVTGGALDQSNGAPAAGAAGVAAAGAAAAGVPVALAGGAGSAASPCNASPHIPAPRHNFKSDPRVRPGNVRDSVTLIAWEVRGQG
ncbi:hypothetical protein, partial [Nitrosospira sp. NpAV]|uniref:hypothetical protein n=1 Tax=Nitrosospira sp. NpAV TaxID=58133 RepID=UPI001E2AC9DB